MRQMCQKLTCVIHCIGKDVVAIGAQFQTGNGIPVSLHAVDHLIVPEIPYLCGVYVCVVCVCVCVCVCVEGVELMLLIDGCWRQSQANIVGRWSSYNG